MSKKDLLILERSSSSLEFKAEAGVYILEGIFGELDKKNRNNRIYTAEEYLPQIEALQDKIKASKLLGELDHPQNFDVSLKNVSHIIEEITYDEENKQIRGRIRLLDTDAGRQAKALVDAGVPLQISSRAAGAVESNGQVKIKQLFTYDLVADPGFENAELKRVNESYGFDNDSDILIYEIGGTANLTENTTIENKEPEKMAESKFITVEDFNKYSQYLSEEIKNIKESLTEARENGNDVELANLKEYATYLAEKLDQSIQYSEHVAEKADQSIQYAETLAEKLDQSIQYSEHIAEGFTQIKEYTNYLAESYNEGATTHANLLEYIEYLKENLEKVTEYAEYVAETVNSNLVLEEEGEEAGLPAEELEDETKVVDNDVEAPENVEKDLELEGEGDAEGEEIAEGNAFGDAVRKAKEAGEKEFEFDGKTYKVEESEEPAEEAEEAAEEAEEAAEEAEEAAEEAEEAAEEAEEAAEESEEESEEAPEAAEEEDAMEAYKNSITEKLSALINKAQEKKTNDPHFFKFVSESTRNSYNELTTEERSKVLSAVEGRGFLTEGQIISLWNSALITDASSNEPNVTKMMPIEYKETWSALSESKKNQILAQAKYHKLETEYQVANFWQTRDLREVAPVMEKVAMIKENVEVKPSVGYDTTDIAAAIAKRFNK